MSQSELDGSAAATRYVFVSVGDGATIPSAEVRVGSGKTCLIGACQIQWHLIGGNSGQGQLEVGEVLTVYLSDR